MKKILNNLPKPVRDKVEAYGEEFIYLNDGRTLRRYTSTHKYPKRAKHPYAVFCAGGFPHIAHLKIEVSQNGYNDLASLAYILPDGGCKFCRDADLLSIGERNYLTDFCKRYNNQTLKQPYMEL